MASRKRFLVSAPQMMALSFGAVILAGTLLLCLPWATAGGGGTGFLDALFTATSAVCVTGLIVVDTGAHFSLFGQIVILALIQAGGLGIMTFSVLAVLMAGGRVSYRFRMALKESLNRLNVRSVMEVALAILVLALVVEAAGFALLWLRWGPDMGWGQAAWQALFHSVSAFCNAGFSLNADSLVQWRDDFFVNTVICLLIIIGGIGFTVIFEVLERKSLKNLSLHSRMALVTSAVLIVGGAVLILVFETFKPPYSFVHYNFYDKAITAVFQSVTARTAGFNTVDIGAMSDASLFLIILLMFVGGSPGGTAGGMKTTTFAALLAAGAAIVRGERDVRIFNRRLSHELLLRAFTIALLSMSIVAAVTLAATAIEGRNFMHLLFEVTSAFGTVGLSTGITAQLAPAEKILIVATMFVGRLGPLTMAMALAQSALKRQFRLPAEEIIIG
jgi:trk system potassium uptake protein TrkH